jgi:hypothetical protein
VFKASYEEVVTFGRWNDGDDGVGSFEVFEALSKHNVEVVRIDVG